MQRREKITDAARGKWKGILSALGINANYLSGKHGPCPICMAGKDRFRFSDKNGDGWWHCNQCGHGSGIDLVMRIKNCDFKSAADLVREHVGEVPVASANSERKGDARKALNDLWRSSVPVTDGDPVSLWLHGRVGFTPATTELRYCSRCRYWDDDRKQASWHPAMVARVLDPEGKPALLHKTYLTADGRKASVEKVRMLMPGRFPPGSAVRLADHGETLGIAEGIETALAASKLFGVPVWAALNAGELEKWVPTAGVKAVVVFGDNDVNFVGQRAAFSLAQRLSREGFSAEVRIPDQPGTDWNDCLINGKRKVA